ncbi:TMEM175 family protein [Bradyrhizobium sp.]|uniref:TMEM175 family protein n=1 Tax=Bradyrhizobium sp. TaxID=376 RepID=UPI003C4D3A35
MTEPDCKPDHFDMRRLDSLSNTIFGVAMTLLAYDMPKSSQVTGQLNGLPDWADLYHIYGERLQALVLSFVIAGLFWLSHHRRLVRQPEAPRGVVMLNLLFLLSIILLPVSNGLYGSYRLSSAVAVLYGVHLTVIAGLNTILWFLVTHNWRGPEFVSSVFPVAIFLPVIAMASVAPQYAQYLWWLAFGGLLIRGGLRPATAPPKPRSSS